MTLTVGSLFSGIGGLELGLERAGMKVIWNSEIDPYASAVLNKHWPDVPNLGDVTTIDWTTVARPDLICGGYPCQPFSLAGKRLGEADPRHLWPHFAAAIRILRPRYALLENVPGHRTKGFDQVLADLAESGYDAEWDCLPASAFGAPHRRDRLYVVAYPSGFCEREPAEPTYSFAACRQAWHESRGGRQHVADTERTGLEGFGALHAETGEVQAPALGWWDVEPAVGRVVDGLPRGLDFSIWESRLRCLGNAVVPQAAEAIGRRILEVHHGRTAD